LASLIIAIVRHGTGLTVRSSLESSGIEIAHFNEKISKRITQKELHGFFKTMQVMDEIIDEVVKTD